MEKKTNENEDEAQFPSVELAYEFVKPSYDWMLSRLEAINTKIQGLLTFATTLTVAMPIFAKAIFDDVDYNSWWFYGAIIGYVLLTVIGIWGIRKGNIRLVHPKNLYDKWLDKSPWEFKKDTIYFAGEDFEDNKKIIEGKSLCRDIMTILLLVEIFSIIVWIVKANQLI
jgi:hypothetical protein